jgi:hypothetical protein
VLSLPRNASGDPLCSGRSSRHARPNPSRIAVHAPCRGDSLFRCRLQRDGPTFSDSLGGNGLSIGVAVLGRTWFNSLWILLADQGVNDFPAPQNLSPDSVPFVPHSLLLLPKSRKVRWSQWVDATLARSPGVRNYEFGQPLFHGYVWIITIALG